jgi:hypothetical protein
MIYYVFQRFSQNKHKRKPHEKTVRNAMFSVLENEEKNCTHLSEKMLTFVIVDRDKANLFLLIWALTWAQ